MADTNSANTSVNGKMGVLGWLTLLFVVLKLNPGGHLDSPVEDWSWWLVFSPILVGFAFFLLCVLAIGVIFGGAALLDWFANRKREKDAKATANMTPGERREYFRNRRK